MIWSITVVAGLLAQLGSQVSANALSDARRVSLAKHVIDTDVVVIGGGATGAYAAVKLKDAGLKVQLVERNDSLGGHTYTYVDPATGGRSESGVVIYENITATNAFAQRVNMPLVNIGSLGTGDGDKLFNFDSGKYLQSSAFNVNQTTAAIQGYAAQLAKYPYLAYGFDLPYPVPEDLLLPFSAFVKKYDIEAIVPVVSSYGQGLGKILDQSTIYVLKNFGLVDIVSFSTGYLTTAAGDNSQLYTNSAAIIGASNIHYRSKVKAIQRFSGTTHSNLVKISTPYGLRYIRAKRILSSIPPTSENLAGWDLSSQECAIFEQFSHSAYYTAIVNNTGFAPDLDVTNGASNQPYDLPILPGIYSIYPAAGLPHTTAQPILGDFSVKYGSPYTLSDEDVKSDIVTEIQRLQRAQNLTVTEPGFVYYDSHTPFELVVPAKAIASGSYEQLYGLQGKKDTWWTGAAFHTHNSALLWRFTDGVVASLVASFK